MSVLRDECVCVCMFECVCVFMVGRWINPGVCLSMLTDTIYSPANWGVRVSHTQSEVEGKQEPCWYRENSSATLPLVITENCWLRTAAAMTASPDSPQPREIGSSCFLLTSWVGMDWFPFNQGNHLFVDHVHTTASPLSLPPSQPSDVGSAVHFSLCKSMYLSETSHQLSLVMTTNVSTVNSLYISIHILWQSNYHFLIWLLKY